jgi:hypothetical protein
VSGCGTSRDFAVTQQFSRFRSEADIQRAALSHVVRQCDLLHLGGAPDNLRTFFRQLNVNERPRGASGTRGNRRFFEPFTYSGRGGRRFKSCHSDQRLALPEISPSMKPSKIGRTRALVQRASWLTLVDDSNALCRSAAWQRRRVRVALTYRLVGFGMPIEPSVPRDEGWRAQDEAPSCQRVRAPLCAG